tara:strand:+ start:44 stop:637 length:594 start_codon:yes stop_codon:yes gene_type:complete
MVQRFEEAPRFQQTQMGVGMPPDDTIQDQIKDLITRFGITKGIQLALSSNISPLAISIALNSPIGDRAVKSTKGMVGKVGSGILGLFNVNQDPRLERALQGAMLRDPQREALTFEQQQSAGLLPQQQAMAQQQAQTQQQIINEINQANQQAQQTGGNFVSGPAGMSGPSSNNPTGFGSNIRIGKANGGLVSLFKKGF